MSASDSSSEVPSEHRVRVRCHSIETHLSPDSRCRVNVEMEWIDGEFFRGEGRGNSTPQGRIMAGVVAAVQALERVAGGRVRIEIRGAKAVRAFDNLLVIVALRAQAGERRYDLLGSIAAPEEDLVRGAVLAVLDATNRIMVPHQTGTPPNPELTYPPTPPA